MKRIGRIHTFLYRLSGGRIGGRAWGLRILLLTTTGRKSGTQWTTPLCCYPDGDDLVVVASNGGGRTPSWFLNLKQNDGATVQLGRERRAVTAREASPDERARLWAAITSVAPGYLKYQERAHRTIPLGILEPAQR